MKIKNGIYVSLLFCLILAVCGCSSIGNSEQKKEVNFSKKMVENLKKEAKTYTEQEIQDGLVPINDFIQISGKITKSDNREEWIKKGDRFILLSGSSKYQVFNEQETPLKIGDKVIVYGEYYGFLKGTLIEREE